VGRIALCRHELAQTASSGLVEPNPDSGETATLACFTGITINRVEARNATRDLHEIERQLL
jgi:hypothetical protein